MRASSVCFDHFSAVLVITAVLDIFDSASAFSKSDLKFWCLNLLVIFHVNLQFVFCTPNQ